MVNLVFLLAIGLIGLSSWAIVDRAIFLYQLWQINRAQAPQLLIDLRILSALSALFLNLIPLGLGIGLGQWRCWARTLTIVVACSLLLPSLLAELGILADETPMRKYNWLIIGICGVILAILLSPKVTRQFRLRNT
jgi:hypothetical protein